MKIVNLPSLPVAVSSAAELAAVKHVENKSTILLAVSGQYLLGTGQTLEDIFKETNGETVVFDSTETAVKGAFAICKKVTLSNNTVTAFKYRVR